MLLLTCKCLNIKIYITCNTENDYTRLKEQNLLPDYIPTGFFPTGEVEVELEAKGIKQEHSYLVHRRHVGNYTVYRCLNCGLDSYAIPGQGDHVIGNNTLLYENSVIDRLLHSAEYSQVFKMVLNNRDVPFAGSMPDPQSRSYESLQSYLNSIQQQLTDFVLQEEASMETRIRTYEESERSAFTELQAGLKEEKKTMISLLLASAQMDTTLETRTDSTKRSTEARKAPAKKKSVSRVKSMPPTLEQDGDDDALFGFDGFHDTNDETFYGDNGSSSDEDTADDAFEEKPARVRPREITKARLTYSSSVPITVPTWVRDQTGVPTDEECTPSEPDQIAACMQALAQSITDDNRYIFGERPRPRLNTGDFSNR